MKRTRCDAVVVQLIVTEYDEHGRPIGEKTSQPVKVFRAGAPDFWAEADKAVKAMQQADAPAPTPMPPNKARRRK